MVWGLGNGLCIYFADLAEDHYLFPLATGWLLSRPPLMECIVLDLFGSSVEHGNEENGTKGTRISTERSPNLGYLETWTCPLLIRLSYSTSTALDSTEAAVVVPVLCQYQ